MLNNTSDYNLEKISTTQFGDHLEATIQMGGSLFVCGRRGSGKTLITKEQIEKSKCKGVILNASTFERVDAGGFPKIFDSTAEYIKFILPEYYKPLIEGEEPCVLFLDEIDKVDPTVVAPLLEIVQSQTLNNKKLKNLRSTIMAGNLMSEGYDRPPLPLLDRTEKYLLETSHITFLEWGAASKQIHTSVSAFIADNPQCLVGSDDDNGETFADESPRGWTNASKILFFGEKHSWRKSLILSKIAGCIGKRSGMQYNLYFDHYIELLPVAQDILDGKQIKGFSGLESSRQLMCTMIACTRFANILDSLKDGEVPPKSADNLIKFLLSIDEEMALICMRANIKADRIHKHRLLKNNSDWDKLLGLIISRMNRASS